MGGPKGGRGKPANAAANDTPDLGDAQLNAQAAAIKAQLAPDEYETSIKAVIRVRPFKPEGDRQLCIEPVASEGPEALLRIVPNPANKNSRKSEGEIRNYDDIFWSLSPPPDGVSRCATNNDIFHRIGVPVLDKAFRGMNSTVFAYGQTGSGKSFTMGLGEGIPDSDPGLIPAIVKDLFARIESGRTAPQAEGNGEKGGGGEKDVLQEGLKREYEVRCAFMEVFNDHQNGGSVRDLNPYDLFTPEQAKLLRKLYNKEMEKENTATAGATFQQLSDIVAKVLPKADEDEVRTRVAMIFDYRAMDRRLHPHRFNAQIPENGHGGLIKGIRGKEVGLLATKRDDLGEENGHYYPKGLAERRCAGWSDVNALIQSGTGRRKSHATDFNEHSSRSHAIVQLRVDTYLVAEEGGERIKDMTALINLVDLAGSERFDKSGTLASGRQGETQGINTSLEYLGRVLKGMAKGGRTGDVVGALRMVCLTRLLASSIGGNSETWMVACVHPSISEWDETVSTLAYAHLAREIKQVVRQNKTGLNDTAAVIARLAEQLAAIDDESSARFQEKKAELARLERMKSQMEEDRVRERANLERERQRREEVVKAREEQRKAFEGKLSTLEQQAKEAQEAYEKIQKELEDQKRLREEAEKERQEAAARFHELAEEGKRKYEEKIAIIEKSVSDKREQEAQVMALSTAEEKERIERERELESGQVKLEVMRKKEQMLNDQLKALQEGDEDKLRTIEHVKQQFEQVAAETDEHKQKEMLIAADLEERKAKLEAAKKKVAEQREAVRALEDEVKRSMNDQDQLESRIAAREYEIARRHREIEAREEQFQQKYAALNAREKHLQEMDEQLEDIAMSVEESELELTDLNDKLVRIEAEFMDMVKGRQ